MKKPIKMVALLIAMVLLTGLAPVSLAQTADNQRVKLVVAISALPTVENYDTNYWTKKIEDENNVDLEFYLLPSDANDAATKLSLLIASGAKLPDIICMNINDLAAFDYAQNGIFIPLNDYYESDLAKNINAMPQADRDYVVQNLRLPDGNIYSLFAYTPYPWNTMRNRFFINHDWLNQLGLSMPTTTEELRSVLQAFVTNDLNKNGKLDEIGIVGSTNGWGQQPFNYLMNSFIYADASRKYLALSDDGTTVYPSYTQDAWRDGLDYMASLSKEGLLSPLSFTQDYSQLTALVNVEGGMAGVISAGSISAFDQVQSSYSLMPPIAGPEGVRLTAYYAPAPVPFWFITKDSENPDVAFAVGDYMLSQYNFNVTSMGIEGVDWTSDPDVIKEYKTAFEDLLGITANRVQLTNIWNKAQNTHWQGSHPRYQSVDSAMQVGSIKRSDAATGINYTAEHYVTYSPCVPSVLLPKIAYTQEETDQIASIKTTIDAYAYDTAIAFITGVRNISEWENYLNELDRMGLEEYIKVSQDAYNRVK